MKYLSPSEEWAYAAGVKAARKGRPLRDNPYFFDDGDWASIWEDGWEDAFNEMAGMEVPYILGCSIAPTQAEMNIVRSIIAGLREQGFEIVSRDLIGRISDYFHVNAKSTDDLAMGYMQALDVIILRGKANVKYSFPYQQTFDAIAAATESVGPKTVSISVKAFQEAFNNHRDAKPLKEGTKCDR